MGKVGTGAANPNWKGGRVVDPRGYVLIRVGVGHHLADVRGYAYEHRLKAYEAGTLKIDGERREVHHVDETKDNNDINNLEPLTHHEHRARHRTSGKVLQMPGEHNVVIECACGCGIAFEKYDKQGRSRRYYESGHIPQASPTIDAIKNELVKSLVPLGPVVISKNIGLSLTATKVALSKMKKKGIIRHASHGLWWI